jgi:hypothetical protein
MVPLASLTIADVVVSDTGLAAEYRAMLERHGVQIVLA